MDEPNKEIHILQEHIEEEGDLRRQWPEFEDAGSRRAQVVSKQERMPFRGCPLKFLGGRRFSGRCLIF